MKQDAFTGRMFRRLFVPSLWASVGLAFSDMADALVVGWRMGETGLAAIGMTLPLFMVINLFMHGLGIGGSVRYAQMLGAGKFYAFWRIILPNITNGIMVSVMLAMSIVFGDFVIINTLAGNYFPTGQMYLYSAMRQSGQKASAVIVILFIITLAISLVGFGLQKSKKRR